MVLVPSSVLHKYTSGGGGGGGTLDGVLSSTILQLDATVSASYAGSGQTWSNLIAAPADGSAQTSYDFYIGADSSATSTDPTFNGTAGSSSAYFSFDGGDYFKKASANTTFLNNLHKSSGGTDFWIACGLYFPSATSGNIFTTNASTTTTGIRMETQANNTLRLRQRGASGSSNADTTTQVYAATTPTLMILSYSTAGSTRFWVNSRTAENLSISFASGTGDPANPAVIGAGTGGSGLLPSGTRLYGFAMGNEYLDNTKAGLIFDYYNAQHGRTYA